MTMLESDHNEANACHLFIESGLGAIKIKAMSQKPRPRARSLKIVLLMGAGLAACLFWMFDEPSVQQQTLPDGSVLTLSRVLYGDTGEFVHGTRFEQLVRRIIPKKGISFAGLKLNAPGIVSIAGGGRPILVVELRVDANGSSSPMVANPAFTRQYRGTLLGEDGFEYTQELRDFRSYGKGLFSYVYISSFPRDSHRLRLRIDGRDTREGAWRTVAEFDFENPGRAEPRGWKPDLTPATKTAEGIAFTLGEVTVEQQPFNPMDIYTLTVTFPFQVRRDGTTLTNWIPAYVRAEDDTGNHGLSSLFAGFENHWAIRRGWRGPDPRRVWRVEVDFEQEPDSSAGNVFAVPLTSMLPGPSITNLAGLEVTISGDIRESLRVSIPTNRVNLALRFISIRTRTGREMTSLSGNWSQFSFYKLLSEPSLDSESKDVVFAIVPTAHLTFFTQPRTIAE